MTDRAKFDDLPTIVINAIEDKIGPIRTVEAVPGDRPGFAARIYAGEDDVFLKAVPALSPAAEVYRREEWTASHLHPPIPPEGPLRPPAPAPRLLWSTVAGGWLILAFELINDHARHADLRPGSPDLPAVLDVVERLYTALTPSPLPDQEPAVEYVSRVMASHWHLVTDAQRALFTSAVGACKDQYLDGDTLLPGTLGASNMLIKDGQAHVVDWSEALCGPAWINAAMLGPCLIAAGHSPEQAEAVLSAATAWMDAPADGVAGLAAVRVLPLLHQIHAGPVERRKAAARKADAHWQWAAHMLGMSLPAGCEGR
ncbi:hypothetical protein [Nonomuraea basaltis]|uniref:hypothetical protein n=1 Tax=Nonomuraea basaltis TaxID=2495887 RepID=UPI00110C47A3|nr:hypothetical protein [Nonomuraea basaltis]TMR97321.1 hypothetical protein EJK15_18795 [Nonomuraea basaltis]